MPDADKASSGRPTTEPHCGVPWRREARWHALGVFALLMVAIQLICGPKLRLSQWAAEARSNAAIAEGLAWLEGRVDITPENPNGLDLSDAGNRMHDTAYFDGRVYNVFPPLASIITLILYPLNLLLQAPPGFWLTTPMVLLVFWPLPIAGFLTFRRRTGNSIWAAVLTLGWIGGTAVLPNLNGTATGHLGQMDHVLSQIGLLILADNVLCGRSTWPGVIGLLLSVWSRQITFLYAPVLLISAAMRRGWRGVLVVATGVVVIASPLLVLNYLKFGNPLDFGYRYIYVGREDAGMGRRVAEHGVFSTHFIPENLYYMHVAPPDVDLANSSLTLLKVSDSNQYGTSLWLTSPIALWIIIAAGRWWREPAARWLMLGTIPIMAGLACYHSPGYISHGYARFALDFLPVWLLVVAPFTLGGHRSVAPGANASVPGLQHEAPRALPMHGWRTWLSLAMIAWGLLYFQSITPDRPMAPRAVAPSAAG